MIEHAGLRQHHMNHEFAAVHDHPFAATFALDRIDVAARRFHAIGDVSRERFGLPRALGCADDDRVVERGQRTCIKRRNVRRFDVFQRLNGGLLNFVETQ